jgi:hypothetical protein
MRELQVLDDAGLDDVALAVDQQRELAQPAAIYASPLAFEWWPQAPAGQYESYAGAERASDTGHWDDGK